MSSRISALFLFCVLLIPFASPAVHGAESSNVFLPGHVQAADGEVTLFADYGSIQTNGRVPVYLVNKSPEDLVLNTQDGDIYLKLQYQDADGDWVRAQPHGYSWCGNSYVTRTVPAGHFLLVSGYQPINGVPSTVRYKLYSQDIELSSNTGAGVVAEADIERASSDVMSIGEGSREHVVQVALSEVPVTNTMDHMRDLRLVAIRALASGRFDPEEGRRILLQVREQSPDLAEAVDRALQ